MRRSAILLPNPLKPTAHSGLGVGEYSAMHFMGALFPATAGVMLYGWRADRKSTRLNSSHRP